MKTLVLGITSQASRPASSSNRPLSLVVWGWHVGLVDGRRAVCQASCRVLQRSHTPWSLISGSQHHVTQQGETKSGAFMPQPPLWHGPHRLVVRTSRCGRDNPGSTPGVDIFLPRNTFTKRLPADCLSWSISCFLQSSILATPPGLFGHSLGLRSHMVFSKCAVPDATFACIFNAVSDGSQPSLLT